MIYTEVSYIPNNNCPICLVQLGEKQEDGTIEKIYAHVNQHFIHASCCRELACGATPKSLLRCPICRVACIIDPNLYTEEEKIQLVQRDINSKISKFGTRTALFFTAISIYNMLTDNNYLAEGIAYQISGDVITALAISVAWMAGSD